MKIHKGDQVKIITGKDKGKVGAVTFILRKSNRVVVTGVNIVKKHEKKNQAKDKKGGIIELEAPIHISNVQLLDPVKNKPVRVGFELSKNKDKQEKKIRVTKKYHTKLK